METQVLPEQPEILKGLVLEQTIELVKEVAKKSGRNVDKIEIHTPHDYAWSCLMDAVVITAHLGIKQVKLISFRSVIGKYNVNYGEQFLCGAEVVYDYSTKKTTFKERLIVFEAFRSEICDTCDNVKEYCTCGNEMELDLRNVDSFFGLDDVEIIDEQNLVTKAPIEYNISQEELATLITGVCKSMGLKVKDVTSRANQLLTENPLITSEEIVTEILRSGV